MVSFIACCVFDWQPW